MGHVFDELVRRTRGTAIVLEVPDARLALCPTLGGRLFAELAGQFLHRVDLAAVAHPNNPFNNFGGNNFWPAPEGGKFGFNYRGDEWYVQPCINSQPFEKLWAEMSAAAVQKQVTLTNRAGVTVTAAMRRELRLGPLPPWLSQAGAEQAFSYVTRDSFTVLGSTPVEEALIAAWSLEQFRATAGTTAFCLVEQPEAAINFDYYEHPAERITYHQHGLTYRTDGQRRGQIGIRAGAGARCIGFYDVPARLLCVRDNRCAVGGIYFNVADNDQPQGPYSAADSYSIFNSNPDMGAFELETVGAAQVEQGILKGSELSSATSFLAFPDSSALERFLEEQLGPKEA